MCFCNLKQLVMFCVLCLFEQSNTFVSVVVGTWGALRLALSMGSKDEKRMSLFCPAFEPIVLVSLGKSLHFASCRKHVHAESISVHF